MREYPIPLAALDDRLGFVGTAGSGKTYNAGSGVERVLAQGGRVVIPDPLGVWWGLALSADGRSPAPWREKQRLVIFGGEHGDLPLNEHAGALIGETVAGMAESAILDLSGIGTKAAERRFMLAFLTAFYRHASGEPVHLVFDEADMWAPQRLLDKEGEAAKLLGMMETVVRRGRIKGFIPWLISQRPAVLSKDVLSQVDGLVAFKLTSSQDRNALKGWVEGQADDGQWPAIYAALPGLPRGTGIVWLPGRGTLEQASFPAKVTFDSSRTPTRGERVERRDLKPLNLEALKGKLASIEEEAKANDPRHLKAEVVRLTRELAKAQRSVAAPPTPEKVVANAEEIEEARKQGELAGIAIGIARAQAAVNALRVDGAPAKRPKRTPVQTVPVVERVPQPPAVPVAALDDAGGVPAGTRPTLSALVSAYPSGMTPGQLAARVGIKKKGSTFSAYKSRLRTAGLIEERAGLLFATDAGVSAIGDVAPLPAPGPELARSWAKKLPGTGPIVELLLASHPAWRDRSEIAEALNINPSGSTLSAYISRLSTAGVITKSGTAIRLSEEIMGA